MQVVNNVFPPQPWSIYILYYIYISGRGYPPTIQLKSTMFTSHLNNKARNSAGNSDVD